VVIAEERHRVEHMGEHDLSLQWRQLEAFRADHPPRHVWAAGLNWENIISGRWDPPFLIQSRAMRGASRSHTVGILRAGPAPISRCSAVARLQRCATDLV
jgi:hypothetical protein